METNPSTAAWIVAALGNLYDQKDFSDFTVMVDGHEFSCHKFILSACSEYFSGLFRSDMRESEEGVVHLQGITCETFQSILDVLYKGRKVLNRENIVDLWQGSHQLQIDGFLAECEEFVMKNMDVSNYEEFYRKARLLSSEKVERHAVDSFMAKRYEHFVTTDLFLDLSSTELSRVIENEHLSVLSEDVVVKSILSWLGNTKNIHSSSSACPQGKFNKNGKRRASLSQAAVPKQISSIFPRYKVTNLSKLLLATKLALVSEECLTSLQNDILNLGDPDAQAVMNRAMFAKFYSCSQRCILGIAAQRPYSFLKDGLLFLNEKQQCVSFFNLQTRQFTLSGKRVRNYMSPPLFSTGVDSLLNLTPRHRRSVSDVYVESIESLCMLHLPEEQRINLHLSPNNATLTNPAVIFHKNYMYCLDAAANITRFDISRQCWDQYTATDDVAIHKSTRIYSYALSKDKILLFRETLNNNRAVVTCFDTVTRQTTTVQCFEGSARRVTFFNTYESTYILQEDGTVWKLVHSDSELKLERITKMWISGWLVRACMYYEDTVFVFRKRTSSTTQAPATKNVLWDSHEICFVSVTTEDHNVPVTLSNKVLEAFQ